ncbi:MAG: dipicolinate synthase subunit B [Clostridia bacterium]|nr:dipicolinate synthase subunit B [Clostridia bacterium]
MDVSYLNIGFALTGSFCTFSKVLPEIKRLADMGAEVYPIMSEMAYSTDTRFGNAEDFRRTIEDITGRKIIHSIKDAEPIGPRHYLDALVVAPCTGNTIAKLANGITDSCVAMAAKAHLRNAGPLVIAVSTNDGLGTSAKNIGMLMNMQNVYFVPFNQDDPIKKPKSLVADMTKIAPTVESALDRVQLQPMLLV